jgi:hypothetical protein
MRVRCFMLAAISQKRMSNPFCKRRHHQRGAWANRIEWREARGRLILGAHISLTLHITSSS